MVSAIGNDGPLYGLVCFCTVLLWLCWFTSASFFDVKWSLSSPRMVCFAFMCLFVCLSAG